LTAVPPADYVRDTMSVSASLPLWDDLVQHDRQYLFLVLVGFLASFGFIRLSTRLMRSPRVPWWPGSVVSEGGVHVHHLVFGIVTMMAAGVISFALSETGVWYELCAVAFGIGIGLTIDEFALWIYLDDVYWSKEGRSSIDATLLATALMGLVLLGAAPFEINTETWPVLIVTVAVTALQIAVVAVCFLKQRLFHGAVGLMLPIFAYYAACRIGKPGSPWARRRYGTRNPAKQAKAERRFRPDRRTEHLKERMRDAVGGSTTEEYQARLASRAPPPPDPEP
jgi:hypothetical protein